MPCRINITYEVYYSIYYELALELLTFVLLYQTDLMLDITIVIEVAGIYVDITFNMQTVTIPQRNL